MNAIEEELIKAKTNGKADKSLLEDKVLFHGSRGGIVGDISPISRSRCDLGKGFYLGDSEMQAKGLVCDDSSPVLYRIKLHLSECDPKKILVLSDDEWLYTVLANRRKCEEFNRLQLAHTYLRMTEKYDIIIGPIADDRMNLAISSFVNQALTTDGLKGCLQYVDYGFQYVLKTPEACKLAEIVDSQKITVRDLEYIREYSEKQRENSFNVVKNMINKYQRQGLYLNEIIQKEKQKDAMKRAITKEPR